ncbi:hypothetical protein [Phenylobacterium sp.]|uniref:hypothetical protein n=1 Tax=Phenylobacterium sp. TaxID=1871053 RepID=UPI0026083346|nr:hypothetical protein [Phenylobacterium sp.]
MDPLVFQPLLFAAIALAGALACAGLLLRRRRIGRGRVGVMVSAAGFLSLAAVAAFVGLFYAVIP